MANTKTEVKNTIPEWVGYVLPFFTYICLIGLVGFLMEQIYKKIIHVKKFLNSEKIQLKEEVATYKKNVSDLTSELNTADMNLWRIRDDCEHKLDLIENKFRQYRINHPYTKLDHHQLTKKIEQLTSQRDNSESCLNQMIKKNNSLAKHQKKLTDELNILEQTVSKLWKTHQELVECERKLNRKSSELETTRKNFQGQLTLLERQYEAKIKILENNAAAELAKKLEICKQEVQNSVEGQSALWLEKLFHLYTERKKREEEIQKRSNSLVTTTPIGGGPGEIGGMMLNEALPKFSSCLVPAQSFLDEGHLASNKIFEILRQDTRFSIDRVLIGGSCGKKTAISFAGHEPDYDLIIFLNDQLPPWQPGGVMDDIEEAFSDFNDRCDDDEAEIEIEDDCNFVIRFKFKFENFQFDLTPAANLRPKNQNWNRESQFVSSLNQMKICYDEEKFDFHYSRSKVRHWSSSMAEFTVDFVREQSGFTHELIRLAKFWNAHVKLGQSEAEESNLYISGRSYMIELVVIHVVAVGGASLKNDLFVGMKNFLELMKNFKNLSIIFDSLYKREEVPPQILSKRPLILDPVCPYHNLANFRTKSQTSSKIIKQFQHKAEISLTKLELLKNNFFSDMTQVEDIFS